MSAIGAATATVAAIHGTSRRPGLRSSPSFSCAAGRSRGPGQIEKVLTSRRGWDVRYGRNDQLKEISEVQAVAFFEPVNPLLDPVLLEHFKADVTVTLGRKYEFLDSRRFAPLVATATAPDDKRSKSAPAPARGGWGTTNTTTATTTARWPLSLSATSASKVIGVVELSIQRDADVLHRLPIPEAGRGLKGSVTPWADGLGEPGGEMEEWAERRAAAAGYKPRPGRWLGGAPADEYAYVSCMCVDDDWRRRGVADALMQAAEKVSTQWGYDCACLHVFQRNAAAIALYRRCGYHVVDDACSPWDAVVGKQRYLMVKRLR